MFKNIARLGAAFIAAVGLSFSAAASTFSIDYSDLWGGGQPAPTEAGWGLNLIQQGDIIFGTMFVYGADNTARWFSVTLSPTGGTTTWSGPLDQTTGSYYGTTWNNGSVTHNVVGNMTVTFANANAGTLTYSVNGVNVTKSISRFNLRGPNLAGKYVGGGFGTGPQSGCGSQGISIFDTLNISQNGNSVILRVDFVNGNNQQATCTYTGTLAVTGRTGSISGNFSCQVGSSVTNSGTFSITNLETSVNGFNGNFNSSDQFCTATGRFGGIKDVI